MEINDPAKVTSSEEIRLWKEYLKQNLLKHTSKYPELRTITEIKEEKTRSFGKSDPVKIPKVLRFDFNASFFQLSFDGKIPQLFVYFHESDLFICYDNVREKPVASVMAFYHYAMRKKLGNKYKYFNSSRGFYQTKEKGLVEQFKKQLSKSTYGGIFEPTELIRTRELSITSERVFFDVEWDEYYKDAEFENFINGRPLGRRK
jgi:hypothetical protein